LVRVYCACACRSIATSAGPSTMSSLPPRQPAMHLDEAGDGVRKASERLVWCAREARHLEFIAGGHPVVALALSLAGLEHDLVPAHPIGPAPADPPGHGHSPLPG